MPVRQKVRDTAPATKPVKRPSLTTVINSYDYGWCRATQHNWKRPDGSHIEIINKAYVVKFDCETCGGERFDHVSTFTGELMKRQYRMPKGYRLVGMGKEIYNKSKWRKNVYRNLVKGGDES